MAKDPFKKLTIAASGAFGPDRTYTAIRRWVELAGGRFATAINNEVTHLVADEDHWRDESPFVKDAKALGTIHIVTFDWLEDSLCKQHAYSPKKYLWTTVEKCKNVAKGRKKKEKKEESEEVKQFKKGAQAAKRDLQSGTSEESSADEEDHEDSAAGAASRGRGTGRGRGRGRGRARGRGTGRGRGRGRGASKAGGNSSRATKAQPAPISEDDDEPLLGDSKAKTPQPSPTRSSSSPSPTPTRPLDSSVQKLAAFRAAAAAQRAENLSKKIRSNLSSCASFTDNYHVYVDQTGFPHNITMTRVNVLANTSERIELSLYESDLETTKFYAVHIAYSGPNHAEEKKILVNPGAEFGDAFEKFRAAFKRVCLIPWEQRLIPEACNRSSFRDVEMHKRAQKEMEKFGEIFTYRKPDGSWFDPQKMEDDEDEATDVGPDGKRKRVDSGKKRKRRKKNADDSDDEERGIKLLSSEDLKDCRIMPFKYVPPPKGKPRGALPTFNRVVGKDDMKLDEDFLTMPKL